MPGPAWQASEHKRPRKWLFSRTQLTKTSSGSHCSQFSRKRVWAKSPTHLEGRLDLGLGFFYCFLLPLLLPGTQFPKIWTREVGVHPWALSARMLWHPAFQTLISLCPAPINLETVFCRSFYRYWRAGNQSQAGPLLLTYITAPVAHCKLNFVAVIV